MAFPEQAVITIPQAAGAVVPGDSAIVDVRQWVDKGYDFLRDGAATFSASDLMGSVSGQNWTSIVSLAATAQGAIPAQYNWVRVTVGALGAGVLGATTQLRVAGKVVPR